MPKDIQDKIDEMYTDMMGFHSEMRSAWIGQKGKCETCLKSLSVLNKQINGNGKPGILAEVQELNMFKRVHYFIYCGVFIPLLTAVVFLAIFYIKNVSR